MVIGLVGKSCAVAGAGIVPVAMPNIAAAMAPRRDQFIACMDALPLSSWFVRGD
jgi:hypothetical protein